MFGYVRTDTAELKVKEHELYKAVYCGLCRAQRKYTGLFSSLFLSYDFVFLYFLRAEATATPTTFRRRRRSLFHAQMRNVAQPNEQLIYCACSAALLSYYKILDDLNDERRSGRLRARLLLPIAKRGAKKARKVLALPEEELVALLEAQADLEKDRSTPPGPASEPSGGIFGLFASFGVKDPVVSYALEKIGRQVGIWLYLTDAADDLEKDLHSGAFNPFSSTPLRRDDLIAALDNHCEEAELTLRRLPVYDAGYRAILMNILTSGLCKEAKRAICKENVTDNG